jgi:hypothetical protein
MKSPVFFKSANELRKWLDERKAGGNAFEKIGDIKLCKKLVNLSRMKMLKAHLPLHSQII